MISLAHSYCTASVDRFVPKPSLVAEAIPMSEFPDYVKQMHQKGKDSFAADFNVRTLA